MVTRTGDREIGVVSGRLPDNPGELACMQHGKGDSIFPFRMKKAVDLEWRLGRWFITTPLPPDTHTICATKNNQPKVFAVIVKRIRK